MTGERGGNHIGGKSDVKKTQNKRGRQPTGRGIPVKATKKK